MVINDPDTMKRVAKLRRLMNEYIRNMNPQERDRRLQVHLAEARGPVGNGKALRLLMNVFIRTKQAQLAHEKSGKARSDGESA